MGNGNGFLGMYSQMPGPGSERRDPPDIPVTKYVPSAQKDIEANLSSAHLLADASSPPLLASVSPPTSADDSAVPSFAQMLKLGRPKPQPEPRATTVAAGAAATNQPVDADERPPPVFGDSFGLAIQAALDNLNHPTTTTAADSASASSSSQENSKKKKKKKGTVLFSM